MFCFKELAGFFVDCLRMSLGLLGNFEKFHLFFDFTRIVEILLGCFYDFTADFWGFYWDIAGICCGKLKLFLDSVVFGGFCWLYMRLFGCFFTILRRFVEIV